MTGVTVLDAYWTCCGKEFRDKGQLRKHQVTAQCAGLHRLLDQHERMWSVLKESNKALWMRERLNVHSTKSLAATICDEMIDNLRHNVGEQKKRNERLQQSADVVKPEAR